MRNQKYHSERAKPTYEGQEFDVEIDLLLRIFFNEVCHIDDQQNTFYYGESKHNKIYK